MTIMLATLPVTLTPIVTDFKQGDHVQLGDGRKGTILAIADEGYADVIVDDARYCLFIPLDDLTVIDASSAPAPAAAPAQTLTTPLVTKESDTRNPTIYDFWDFKKDHTEGVTSITVSPKKEKKDKAKAPRGMHQMDMAAFLNAEPDFNTRPSPTNYQPGRGARSGPPTNQGTTKMLTTLPTYPLCESYSNDVIASVQSAFPALEAQAFNADVHSPITIEARNPLNGDCWTIIGTVGPTPRNPANIEILIGDDPRGNPVARFAGPAKKAPDSPTVCRTFVEYVKRRARQAGKGNRSQAGHQCQPGSRQQAHQASQSEQAYR